MNTLPASSPRGPRPYGAPAVWPTTQGGRDHQAVADFFDRQEILELVRQERFWRDQRQWRNLADCYVEESRVLTTWFDGTGQGFAAASRELYEIRGSRAQHEIRPGYVRIQGDRAICESAGSIFVRIDINGLEADITNYARFHSLLVRTGSGWRLKTFTGIYHKDTLIPVNPDAQLSLDWPMLMTFRPSYRFLCYTMMQRGYAVSQELPGDDRIEPLNVFYAAADRWLAGGAAPF